MYIYLQRISSFFETAESKNKIHAFVNLYKMKSIVMFRNFIAKKGGNVMIHKPHFKVCTISFERPVNYLCDAWHVFPLKYEAWTHFNN